MSRDVRGSITESRDPDHTFHDVRSEYIRPVKKMHRVPYIYRSEPVALGYLHEEKGKCLGEKQA